MKIIISTNFLRETLKMLKFWATLLVATFITHNCFAATALEVSITEIKADVLFIRHALAPGIGDPKNFLLSDCDTQRNLNEEGRTIIIITHDSVVSEHARRILTLRDGQIASDRINENFKKPRAGFSRVATQ